MRRDELLLKLRAGKKEMMQRFGVEKLSLFGSYARDEANEQSDIDLLVKMPPSFEKFFELQQFLEKQLGKRVDLGTKLRPYIFRKISGEMIDV